MSAYFSVFGVISWLFVSMMFVGVVGWAMHAEGVKIQTRIFVFILIFTIWGSLFIFGGFDRERDKEAAAQEEAEWTAKGYPVYKGQCGSSKAPYECEQKAVVVGRNRVGNIFVNAYPICAK